jgi:hypothetical protein
MDRQQFDPLVYYRLKARLLELMVQQLQSEMALRDVQMKRGLLLATHGIPAEGVLVTFDDDLYAVTAKKET